MREGRALASRRFRPQRIESHRERWRRIESRELTVVGMNRFDSTEPSPLTADADGGIMVVDPAVESEQRAAGVDPSAGDRGTAPN